MTSAEWEAAVNQYRIVLQCDGVPPACGEEGASCITAEFAKRPWHQNAVCLWDGKNLVLSVDNDFDPNGLASQDEFSDAISICIAPGFDGDLHVVSVTAVNQNNLPSGADGRP